MSQYFLFKFLAVSFCCFSIVIGMSIDNNKVNETSKKIIDTKSESFTAKTKDLKKLSNEILKKQFTLKDNQNDRQQSILGLPEEVPEIDEEFTSHIKFIIFKNSVLAYKYDDFDRTQNTSIEQYCGPNENNTFIIHGWRESAETEWVQLLIQKFAQYRNGCIIAVDYEKLANRPYSKLLQYFDSITNILYETIETWKTQGLDLNKTHIFGFDYGGRIALQLGEKLGTNAVKSIDVCDIAGPGFDDKFSTTDFRQSAQNVQCIHTSNDKGTHQYENCHQNWRMGFCGYRQPDSDMSPLSYFKYKSSHRICPYYYLMSFDQNIYAMEKGPFECSTLNRSSSFPENFKMGFLEDRKSEVHGEFFVVHPPQYPFKELPSSEHESSTISKVIEYYREEIVGYKDSPSTIEQFESSILAAIRSFEPALVSLIIRFG